MFWGKIVYTSLVFWQHILVCIGRNVLQFAYTKN